jgi:hypothetical protein
VYLNEVGLLQDKSISCRSGEYKGEYTSHVGIGIPRRLFRRFIVPPDAPCVPDLVTRIAFRLQKLLFESSTRPQRKLIHHFAVDALRH